jgi:hypothetical protein
MTRFKELARIRAAIKHKDERELRWAVGYCRMRLQIAPRKDHAEYWKKLERETTSALHDLSRQR